MLAALAVVPGLILSEAPALACLWDTDTLADEARGLPDVSDMQKARGYIAEAIALNPTRTSGVSGSS